MNIIQNKQVYFRQLNILNYQDALEYQLRLFNEIIAIKTTNRNISSEDYKLTPNYLLFCQHPHVYTLGKSGKETNLLINQNELLKLHASFYHINRGGDITYHGPGQIVGYPILDLENFFTDIHKYLRLLEEAVIQTLADYGIIAGRIPGLTGVWIDHLNPKNARKICALGVKTSRWITMHGFAFNINTDLSFFENIIPCGIEDKAVTSMKYELGKHQDLQQVESLLLQHFIKLFNMKIEFY